MKKYTRPIIYGGLDGIITTFSVVSGVVGGKLAIATIIVLGVSNLLSDGFSMGAGDYLSATTEDRMSPKDAFKSAAATFASFNVFGAIPLLAYTISVNFVSTDFAFPLACVFVGIALSLLGYVKASLTEQTKFTAICQTVAIGTVASFVAYLVGALIGGLN